MVFRNKNVFHVSFIFRMIVYACRGPVFSQCLEIKITRGLFTSDELHLLNRRTNFRFNITRVFCVVTPLGPLYVIDYNTSRIPCSVA